MLGLTLFVVCRGNRPIGGISMVGAAPLVHFCRLLVVLYVSQRLLCEDLGRARARHSYVHGKDLVFFRIERPQIVPTS